MYRKVTPMVTLHLVVTEDLFEMKCRLRYRLPKKDGKRMEFWAKGRASENALGLQQTWCAGEIWKR